MTTVSIENLYKEHGSHLRNYARKITQNDVVADDILQETFVKACRHVQKGKTLDKPFRWLTRVVKTTAISMYYRDRHVAAGSLNSNVGDTQLDECDLLENPETPKAETIPLTGAEGLQPEEWVNRKQELQITLQTLEAINPKHAEAFMRKRVLGQSIKEISKAMNISESVTQNNISFAWKEIRNDLAKHGIEI